jgi:DNA polymerase III delta prime subunit
VFSEIKSIKYVGKRRVLNLEVVKNHTFITGNGIVVHNCDWMSSASQKCILDLQETVQSMTRFIFCCNYEHKILPELKSRCQVIHLGNPPATDIFKHCSKVLLNEGIKVHDKKAVVSLIKEMYPDIRGILNTLQMNVVDGEIKDIRTYNTNDVYADILKSIKDKDPNNVRQLLRSNMVHYPELFSYLYENVSEFTDVGNAIIMIGEHLYRDNFVSIKEINFLAMVLRMIRDKVV